jgi:hypothetical protein
LIRLVAARQGATAAQAQAALEQLGTRPGLYFGIDAGVPGLHPLQATLLTRPALRLALFSNGVQARALTPLGAALLANTALSRLVRGQAEGTLAQLRGLMAAFGNCAA